MSRKLTAEQVIEIYRLSSSYSLSLSQIAAKFGCSTPAVVAIRDGRIRKDVIQLYKSLISTACPKREVEQVLEESKQVLEDTKSQQESRSERIKKFIPLLKNSIKANKDARKDYERDQRKSSE